MASHIVTNEVTHQDQVKESTKEVVNEVVVTHLLVVSTLCQVLMLMMSVSYLFYSMTECICIHPNSTNTFEPV